MARTLLTENIWQQIQNTMRLHGCYRSKNSRNIMEVILWKLRTGSPWRDLPPHFGKWNTVFKRYRDWVKAGVFETIFASVNEDVDFQALLADKAFDADWLIQELNERKVKVVIPPKSNRKVMRAFYTIMYKWRHLIENYFCKLKEFKRIAMRSCKTDTSFEAMIQSCASVINSR